MWRAAWGTDAEEETEEAAPAAVRVAVPAQHTLAHRATPRYRTGFSASSCTGAASPMHDGALSHQGEHTTASKRRGPAASAVPRLLRWWWWWGRTPPASESVDDGAPIIHRHHPPCTFAHLLRWLRRRFADCLLAERQRRHGRPPRSASRSLLRLRGCCRCDRWGVAGLVCLVPAALVALLGIFVLLWALALIAVDGDTADRVRRGLTSPIHPTKTLRVQRHGAASGGTTVKTSSSGVLIVPSAQHAFANVLERVVTVALMYTLQVLLGRPTPESDAVAELRRLRDHKRRVAGSGSHTVYAEVIGEHHWGYAFAGEPRSAAAGQLPRHGDTSLVRLRKPVLASLATCVAGAGAAESALGSGTAAGAMLATVTKPSAPMPASAQCLTRRQNRIACADAEAAGAGDGAGSLLQELYEQRRVAVTGAELARLYYDATPGLAAAEVSAWRGGDAVPVSPRTAMQEERFRRASAPEPAVRDAVRASGVVMILAGMGDRQPEFRGNIFQRVTLPLLEGHFLALHPHYPVHIFYEADDVAFAGVGVRGGAAGPVRDWTLRTALRHSDVHTVLHAWEPSSWVPAPPPVLVDSADMLPAMYAAHAAEDAWFRRVADAVPSAPYVTFENVRHLFSLLPCDVTPEMVDKWIKNPDGPSFHGAGYRHMCRFWARLLWRLPSLRVWTGDASDADAALPPWRHRYAYYWRLDTDSWLGKPVLCDPFVTMAQQRCAYGYKDTLQDVPLSSRSLGDALWEWLEKRSGPSRNASRTAATAASGIDAGSGARWGTLTDPSNDGVVTLVRNGTAPPLPATWPWYGVYPERSSAALSPSERDVLKAYFFTGDWRKNDSMEVSDDPPSPLGYNRFMYYNNFELGAFALKTHPLYVSVVDYLDNGDHEDYAAAEREALHGRCTLRGVEGAGGAARANAAFVLTPVGGGALPDAAHPLRCKSPTLASETGPWRSGYMQHRWGDAPVHAFGVEAVMLREGWGVCRFAESFGDYEHSPFA